MHQRIGIPSWFWAAAACHECGGGDVWKIIIPSLTTQRLSITGAAAPTAAAMQRACWTAHAQVRAARQCTHFLCLLQRQEFVDCHSRAPSSLLELISMICWAYICEEYCTHIHVSHVLSTQFQSRFEVVVLSSEAIFNSYAIAWYNTVECVLLLGQQSLE